jgi:hypothetical protein
LSVELEQRIPGYITSDSETDILLWVNEIQYSSLVFEAQDLEIDTLLQKQADSLVGSIAVNHTVYVESVKTNDYVNQPMSLHKATELAAEGNEEARKMLEVNATIDYIERSYKAGFFCPPIELQKHSDGSLTQNGQSLEEVHTNTIKYIDNPKLKERAMTVELLNSIRDQHYSKQGLLKDNARLIISPVHDAMDDTEAADAGFFVPTRSVALQLLTEHEGKTIIQVAFLTTKDTQSGVFDKSAIVNFAQKFGKNFEEASSEEIVGRPLLINKKLLPDLIVSVAELFDDSASEVTGERRFLGEATDIPVSSQDYKKKFKECQSISKNMKNDIDEVVSKLITSKPKNPTEATSKLAELNDKLLKERIVQDDSIDARVLGEETAYFVEHARFVNQLDPNIFIHQQRDMNMLQKEINKGQSSSCPGGSSSRKSNDISTDGINSPFGEPQGDNNDSDEIVEDCEFLAEQCPKCEAKKIMVTCKKGKYYGSCGCVSD